MTPTDILGITLLIAYSIYGVIAIYEVLTLPAEAVAEFEDEEKDPFHLL